MVKKYVITATAIGFSLLLGKGLAQVLPMLPGSLFGMIIFACLLAFGVLEDDSTGRVVAKLIYYMPIVFLPICVGVMAYGDLIVQVGYKLILVGVVTCLLVMTIVGTMAERILAQPAVSNDSDIEPG